MVDNLLYGKYKHYFVTVKGEMDTFLLLAKKREVPMGYMCIL